jgi:hypothetical protein
VNNQQEVKNSKIANATGAMKKEENKETDTWPFT